MTSAEIQEYIDGGEIGVFIPPGIHTLKDTIRMRGRALTFLGVYGHSILAPAEDGMCLMDVDSPGACTFRDMVFHSMGRAGVIGMSIGGPEVSNCGSMIEHCSFIDLRHGVRGKSVDTIKVVDTRFICSAPTGATALSIGNEIEGDTWGGRVVDCDFIGPWENGVLDHGHGLTVRGCGFNGPVYQFRFHGWSRTVNVSGEAVTLASGPGFQMHWAGKTIQIEGEFYTVAAVQSQESMTLATRMDGIGIALRMRFATTGQINIEGNNFDGGDFNYCGIEMVGPNSFYGIRIVNNRFSNWVREMEHNACLINMPRASEISFTSNNCSAARAGAESYGFRAIDCQEAIVVGNNFTNYKEAVVCGNLLAPQSVYSLDGNSFHSCLKQIVRAGNSVVRNHVWG